MYKIRKGYGCDIKATLLTPAGEPCNLRKARYIEAILVLPSGSTMRCEDSAYNEVTNTTVVKLLPTRDLTTVGEFGIFFNVKLEDKTMYSTAVLRFAEVTEDAPVGYRELSLSFSQTVVDFPDNVSFTGASPKISDKNTWLVYDDEQDAYVDTGIDVGFVNLMTRYDEKFAEFVTPCIKATDDANKGAARVNTAVDNAESATAEAITATGEASLASAAAISAAQAADTVTRDAIVATEEAHTQAEAANTSAISADTAAAKAIEATDGLVDVLSILAHSDCTLEERIANLEQLLLDALSGKMYIPALKVQHFEAWGNVNLVLTGSGAPTRSPDKAGQFYVDTLNRVLYFATGNNAVADWK